MTHRIGIYPGTFDPLHQGHLAFCLEAIKRGDVDKVVLLPEPSPRGKPEATTVAMRLGLLKEATAAFPLLRVISLASDRFTISQTLPELQEQFKGAPLSLLIGSDIVPSLPFWKDLEALLAAMPLVIGVRRTDTPDTVRAMIEQIGQTHHLTIRYSLIETIHAHVASSHIRSGKMTADLHI